jgi:hypothetical protein
MVTKTTTDGVVQLFLTGDPNPKLEQETVEFVTIGTRVEYDEDWSETILPPEYDKALVGNDATFANSTISVDGLVAVDETGLFYGLQVNGGTISGSGICRNAVGWYGAGICLTAMTVDGGYFTPGVTSPEDARGLISLRDAFFSACSVSPLNGYTGHGGAIETYGGTLSLVNTDFEGNSATGSGAAGGAMALMYSENTITGGTFSGNTAYFGGAIQQNGGTMSVTGAMFSGNSTSGEATETYPTGNAGGAIELHQGAEASIDQCIFQDNSALRGGAVYNDTFYAAVSNTDIYNSEFNGNSAEAEGGAIYNDAVMLVAASVFNGNTVISTESETVRRGGAIANAKDGTMTVEGCSFSDNRANLGGAIWNEGVMTLENVAIYESYGDYEDYDDYDDRFDDDFDDESENGLDAGSEDGSDDEPAPELENNTVYNCGSVTFHGYNCIETGFVNDGDVTFCINADGFLLNDLTHFHGTGTYLIEVSGEDAAPHAGAYLSEDIGYFTGALSVKLDDTLSSDVFTVSDGSLMNDLAIAGDMVLRLVHHELGSVFLHSVELEDLKPAVSRDGSLVVWSDEGYTGGYRVEFTQEDDFSTAIRIATNGTAFDVSYRSNYLYFCHVAEEGGTFNDAESNVVPTDLDPCQIVSNGNGRADIFFATVDEVDVWSALYQAENTVTGDIAEIAGKNRIRDTFTGADSEANILYLSDTDNGDGLFMDDIYSEFGDAARLSLIREVRAGEGDDVVDMTSERYTAELAGMTVRGGAGNDVLWGAEGGNSLFGDAGNDRIVGNTGDDLIAGGAGDDTLAGGGGNDTFTFGGNWGNDVVSQSATGAVTLWFESGSFANWNASTRTYTDGENSVVVSGVALEKISLKFGDDNDPEKFDDLAAVGAFLECTAEAVFETEEMRTQGILASL